MRNRIALASGIVLFVAGAAYATDSRVESMGKNDTYFMDDMSVWSNPANANLYPNYLFGELGQMRATGDSLFKAYSRYNHDPVQPWFGAIFARSFAPDAAAGNRYPQVVIGGAFNRTDEWNQYFPSTIVLGDSVNHSWDATSVQVNFPVKFTGLLGLATSKGVLLGLKTYLAYGDSSKGASSVTPVISVNTFGVNMPLGQGIDLEASVTASFLDAKINTATHHYGGNFDPSFGGSARLFISAPQISGVVVPAASFRSISTPWLSKTEFRIGSGVNVSLDRGFFWLGVDYFNNTGDENITSGVNAVSNYDRFTNITENGLRISFGIERNIWTDWFVIRAGGQKIIANQDWTKGSDSHSSVITNPEVDDAMNDLISFGFGLNIEDKFKVDVVMAKDFVFTGGALLGGPTDHVLSRISASYSF